MEENDTWHYFSHTYSVGNIEIQTFSSGYCHDNTKYTLPNPKILRIFLYFVLAAVSLLYNSHIGNTEPYFRKTVLRF